MHHKALLNQQIQNRKILIAQVAPAVRVAIGEPFQRNVSTQRMVSGIRKLGFEYVFDTLFSADVTIMEEGTELLERVEKKQLPMFTSCCPGWIQFVESAAPDMLPNISTTKSPQMIMGSIVKNYFSKIKNIQPEDIYMVSIMPCTKKQMEANKSKDKDIDLVITTNELATLWKEMDIETFGESEFDNPMGVGSGGGVIFGRTGGVMEAALRFAYETVVG